jgi:hypothetical protein
MPELREVIRGTKTKIYFQAIVCRRCVLAALRTFRLGLSEVGNQANPLTFPENKIVFPTNLEHKFKITATDHDTQPTNGLASPVTGTLTNRLLPLEPLKAPIYTSPVDSEEDLIVDAAATAR